MPSDCLFCRIAAGDAPARIVHQDEHLIAIEDIHPQAPMHVLVIPRRHIATLNDLAPADDGLVGEMMRRAATLARARGVAESGYRTIFNCNRGAGQTIYHLHLHVIAGRRLSWPPG
jgi:histidine triad (HIT) family protein